MSVSECACAGARLGELRVRGKNNMRINLKKNFFFAGEKRKKNQCPLCECVRTEAEAATDRTVRAHARARTHTLHPDIHPCMNPFSSFLFVCCLNV